MEDKIWLVLLLVGSVACKSQSKSSEDSAAKALGIDIKDYFYFGGCDAGDSTSKLWLHIDENKKITKFVGGIFRNGSKIVFRFDGPVASTGIDNTDPSGLYSLVSTAASSISKVNVDDANDTWNGHVQKIEIRQGSTTTADGKEFKSMLRVTFTSDRDTDGSSLETFLCAFDNATFYRF